MVVPHYAEPDSKSVCHEVLMKIPSPPGSSASTKPSLARLRDGPGRRFMAAAIARGNRLAAPQTSGPPALSLLRREKLHPDHHCRVCAEKTRPACRGALG